MTSLQWWEERLTPINEVRVISTKCPFESELSVAFLRDLELSKNGFKNKI